MSSETPISSSGLYSLTIEKRQVHCLTTPSLKYHGIYVMIYILDGRGLCQVDNTLYRFAPGDIFVIRPNEAYCCFGTDHQSYTSFEIQFERNSFLPFTQAESLRKRLLFPWNTKSVFVHKRTLGIGERRTMEVFMQQMLSISESSNPGDCISQSMKSALLCSLLSFLLDVYHIHDQTQAEEIPNDHMVNRAMQYINLNYDKELTLDSIARYLYVNPSYLSTVFKRETGDALMVYINKRRIRQARYYLTNTQLRITRIAELVGFHSASYFNVVFKSIEGCTPQVYRHDHEDIPEN